MNIYVYLPGQVDKHMHEMREKAALTIQRHWRAFKARRNFHQQKRNLKEYKAAVLIQRAVSTQTNCWHEMKHFASVYFFKKKISSSGPLVHHLTYILKLGC